MCVDRHAGIRLPRQQCMCQHPGQRGAGGRLERTGAEREGGQNICSLVHLPVTCKPCSSGQAGKARSVRLACMRVHERAELHRRLRPCAITP
jgi:hypothetical protein